MGFGYLGEMHVGSLVHLRARDYDPVTGTFLSPDPLDGAPGVDGTTTIANPFHYADNNPLNSSDPTGLRPGEGCAGATIKVLCEYREPLVVATATIGAGIACAVGATPAGPFAMGATGSVCAGMAHRGLTGYFDGENPWTAALNPEAVVTDSLLGAGTAGFGVTLAALRGSLATGANEAVFWSGIGRGGDKIAAGWVAKHGGATLETTLARRGITLPAWDTSKPATVSLWREASAEFARGARGNVRVLQDEFVRMDSTWAKIEFPELVKTGRSRLSQL